MKKLNEKNAVLSGPRLAALYSLMPNRLGFCGSQKNSDQEKMRNFLLGDVSEKEARKILSKFEAAHAYYKLIARKNNIRDPLNKKVVEAYWLGNNLLEKVSVEDIQKMILRDFVKPNLLSRGVAIKRIADIPKKSKAHHSFHVFILGSVTGRVDFSDVKLQDICRPGWGKVVSIKNGKASVEYAPLIRKGKKIEFGRKKRKEINWDEKIVPGIFAGDWVSFHWNFLSQKLEKKDVKNLEKYTKQNLN